MISPARNRTWAEFPKVFVIAGNVDFFPSVRAVIASIQSVFFKDKFQSSYRIIIYDLDGISKDTSKKMELTRVCNLEYRVFDWKQLPENVHDLKIFAWKVIILAEMFKQFNSFVYLDSSVEFFESALRSPQFTWKEANWQPDDRFQIYTRLYGEGKISAVSFTHEAEHGIKFATHPGMYSYIPIEPAYNLMNDIEMHEANFIIVHKSEMTRQWLKWSVLCAVTRDCIEPPGAQLSCDQESKVPPGSCHRQDQSVLNILLNNLEMTMLKQGSKIVTHQSPYNHPSRYYYGHVLRRRQSTIKQLMHC
ncbi:hypothetical protein Ddc_18913 [Ditylenchus destructor]|nr:hypothetical protein Ddc_18913 [Ditylenchus destructor]